MAAATRDDGCGLILRDTVLRSVAQCAIESDTIEANGLLREPDRQFAALLPGKAKSGVATGCGNDR